MNINKFKETLFNRGMDHGFSQMELFKNGNKSFDLRVFEQQIDHYEINENEGIGLRAIFEGKVGYAYTEKINNKAIEELLQNVKQNAEITDKQDEEIFPGSNNYRDLNTYSQNLKKIKTADKIDLVKSLENKAFERDERVSAVNYCIYSDSEFKYSIFNTHGLNLSHKNNIAYLYLSVVVNDNDNIKTCAKHEITQDYSEFEPEALAHKVVDEAVSLLGARSIPSEKYPVILRHDVAAELLSAFSSPFSAENVQKGMSLFKDKLGEKVADENLTIIDDPFLKKGFAATPFDAEGVATVKKNVIENGVLTTYLHNLKTAKKDGVKSTGNAYRGSHKSYIDIAPTNMYIKPGETGYDKMINSINKGVLITKLQGLHAGANSVSGEFSISASGYFIEKGDIKNPVEQITIAGNFLDLLKNIEIIGEDLKMGLPGTSHIGSPSIKVRELDIAGE